MDRKEYLRNYQREWVRKRRLAYFKDKVCKNCPSNENLELHHVNRETKISNHIWSWSDKRRLEELAKCVVLCKDCHRVETRKQVKEWAALPVTHGIKESGYRRGCRCLLCKKSYSIIRKERWIRIKK
jgi:hypothetical protein